MLWNLYTKHRENTHKQAWKLSVSEANGIARTQISIKKKKGLRKSLKIKTNSPQKGKVGGEVEEVTDFYQQRLVFFRPKLFRLHRNTEEIK